MTPRLYVETNFIIGFAYEQHAEQDSILEPASSGKIDLRIPQVAIMEAFKSLERREAEIGQTQQALQSHIDQVRDRKHVSEHALYTIREINASLVALAAAAKRARARTYELCEQFRDSATTLPLPAWPPQKREALLISALPDDMIAQSIISDALENPPVGQAILLTENKSDFGEPTVKNALLAVGVRYMYDTYSALRAIEAKNA